MQVNEAYGLLDGFHHGSVEGHESVLNLIAAAEQLREQQDLFELYVVDYIFLTRCMVRGWVMCGGMAWHPALRGKK